MEHIDEQGKYKKLEDMTRDYILMVWKAYFQNTSRTAKALGMGRTTLYRKLAQYGEVTNKKERA